MNKLFTFLLVALPLFLSAQNEGDIELGVGLGFNSSNFYGDDVVRSDVRTGLQAGVTGEYYFNDRWGFKSGLIYDSKGAEDPVVLVFSDGFNEELIGNDETKLDYLFIPLYANWHFGKNRNWYLNFGLHLDILLNAEEQVSGVNVDIKDDVSSVDVGLGVGIGYKFQISDHARLFIEYQSAGGFVEVFKDGGDILNSRSALNVGIAFTPQF